MLSPFVPHLAEELWSRLGHKGSILQEPWPDYDESALQAESVTIVVQVNGKLRGKLSLSPDAAEAEVRKAAEADERIHANLQGKQVVKVIFVPGKLLNLVVK
jgi:leucyl-tRNA synthetase